VKADPNNKQQVGASMPGMVVSVAVKAGDAVAKGQKLLSLEAMKMETTVVADQEGKIAEIFVKPGTRVETGDLMLTYA
jgi:pyruvate carboxylase